MQRINIFGAKGGVGCSTLSVILAGEMARQGNPVVLYGGTYHTPNADMNRDIQAIAGVRSEPETVSLNENISVVYHTSDIDEDANFLIVDRGTTYAQVDADLNLFILRNDYLSLSRLMRLSFTTDTVTDTVRSFPPNTEFVLVTEPNRVLDEKDCESIVGKKMLFTFPPSSLSTIARSGDAGLVLLRQDRMGRRFAQTVLEALNANRDYQQESTS